MRSFAFILLTSLALAKPIAKSSHARPAPIEKPQAKAPPKQLKALAPAAQMQKAFARDAEDVRLLILASPT